MGIIFSPRVNYFVGKNGYEPFHAHNNDAGYDLSLPKDYRYDPDDTDPIVDFDVRIIIPRGFFGQLCPRSSVSMRGCMVAHGTIDADYSGTISAKFWHIPPDLTAGDRIVQMVILPLANLPWCKVDRVIPEGRGDNGFGSSGK